MDKYVLVQPTMTRTLSYKTTNLKNPFQIAFSSEEEKALRKIGRHLQL